MTEVLSITSQLLQWLHTVITSVSYYDSLCPGIEIVLTLYFQTHTSTVYALKAKYDAALFGAVSSLTTKVLGYTLPIIALRKRMNLYTNVRPVKSVQGVKGPRVDIVIIRENTENLYVKEEKTYNTPEEKVSETIKRISEKASQRIGKMALEIVVQRVQVCAANRSGYPTEPMVTITHKSNSVRVVYDADCVRKSLYSTVNLEEQIVDSMVYKLFRSPKYYDVVVASNLYDLLSDRATALVGSLELVPSANVGDRFVISEPCHGSALDIEGLSITNLIAMIRSIGMMLESMSLGEQAARIYKAMDTNLENRKTLSPDLEGKVKTEEVVQDILRRL
ncbi:dehydrogenase, isocitrate/isopropylmalate family protein [Tirmania nivea]|nr:dehydrogenase, isocitrate/isopropylmalate family protein [Tirmania nivea]